MPQIDNGAHLGGLLGGFIAAAFVALPRKSKPVAQMLSILAYLVLAASLVYYGISGTFLKSNAAVQVQMASEAIQEGNYQKVLELTSEALQSPDNYEAELLFFRSIAHLELNEIQQAIRDLERTVGIKPEFAEAYYNMALLYENQGNITKAAEAAGRAYELKPQNADFKKLYQRLSENG